MKFPAVILCMIALANCGPPVPVVVDAYSSSPGQTIASLGYAPVTLPSTAFGPGTLVSSIKGTGLTAPLNLTYLCRPEYTVIPPLIVDDAASAQVSHALSGTFSLDTAIMKGIGISLGANASYVTSVSISFENVKVEQLAFDDLRAVLDSLGPACANILNDFKAQNLAFQTKQALRADVTYTANLKDGVSADIKNSVILALSAQLGLSVQNSTNNSITGKGLYYGLILVPVT